jgi:hypothetical protein
MGLRLNELVTVTLLAIVTVCGYLVLALNNSDTTGYIALIATPLITAIVGIILGSRLTTVAKAVARVETATNGVASAAFAALGEKVDAVASAAVDVEHRQTDEAQRIARDGPTPVAGNGPGT